MPRDTARARLTEASAREWDDPAEVINLAGALLETGAADVAATVCANLNERQPRFGPGWARRAEVALARGQGNEALDAARRGVELGPDIAFCHICLGLALKAHGRVAEATLQFGQAIKLAPTSPVAWSHYGLLLAEQGRHGMANDALNRACELAPGDAFHHSNRLMTLQYDPRATSAELRHAAESFPQAADKAPRRHAGSADHPRVAFLSSDFYRHPVGWFLAPVLAARKPGKQTWGLYHDGQNEDDLTTRLAGLADGYHRIHGFSDEDLARRLADDGVNVIVELNGHTAGNRLPMLAGRIAPLQLSFLGYPASTGLKTIDGVLVGQAHFSEAASVFYSEPLIELPGTHLVYDPPEFLPPVRRRENGPIRLGSFNNTAKLNDDVIGCWCRILQKIPDATLTLKWRSLADPEFRRHLAALFAARGINAGRLDLQPHSDHAGLLQAYQTIDIALDPFPFSGGLTTCEALAMGVPVVTLAWHRPASRQGAAVLGELGLADLVAESQDQYVDIAVSLAGNSARLAALRSGLRDRLHEYARSQAPRLAEALASRIAAQLESRTS